LEIRTDRENALFASYVIANSYFSREAILRSYGINAFVSYLGTDATFFKPLSLQRESFVLSVGSCLPHKGFDFLIRSLGTLAPSLRPPLLIVSNAASPSWRDHLTRLADGLGVRLEIRERVSDSELVGLYNRTRVFLYAPYLEPFGLAPLEAMACGTPVVAVREGGVRESVSDGVTGVLTDRDEGAFADALRDILNDGVKRSLLGRNGFDAVHDFWTLEHAGERLQRHLKRAINQDTRTVEDSQAPPSPQSQSVPSRNM
jgi:glycosyltransferase involved in cell wall biosynthesis